MENQRLTNSANQMPAHELLTQLSLIKWYSEILLEEKSEKLSPKQKKRLEEIHQANMRAINLIKGLAQD